MCSGAKHKEVRKRVFDDDPITKNAVNHTQEMAATHTQQT